MLYLLIPFLKLILILISTLFFLLVLAILTFRFIIEPLKKGKCVCKTKLNRKVALVTGGNSGIGLETARELARRGAKVIIASRDENKSKEAVNDIILSTANIETEYEYLDLSKFSSIREFVSNFTEKYEKLDILVNNAGCAGTKNRLTEDGMNIVMQINYIGPFLLTKLLLEQLKPKRIVNLTSYLHKYAKLDANDIAGLKLDGSLQPYNNSKLCNVLWTKALAKRYPDVIVNTVHPGAVKTNIFNRMKPWMKKVLFIIFDLFFKTAGEGAQTVIHLCVSPKLTTSGDYYVDCNKYAPAKEALDDDLVEKVWNETMKLVEQAEY